VDNRPWHVGYFADEGELYEWEPSEEEEQEEDDGEDGSGLDPFDDWPDPETYLRRPTSVTSIASTPYALGVIESLIADMQEQLGYSPRNLGYGLKPVYVPNQVPGAILNQAVASSETLVTELQRSQNARLRQPSQRAVSQRGRLPKALDVAFAHKTEIVLAVVAGGALLWLFPPAAPLVPRVAPVLVRAVPVLAALYVKVGQNIKAEAEFKDKVDSFDYLGEEVSEIGIV